METFAFIQAAVEYEDPSPAPQVRSLNDLGSAVSKSTVAGIAVSATTIGVLATPPAQAAVQRGDQCPAVTSVQTALQQRGYSVGAVDGAFGGATEYAVLRFQQRNQLGADGVVGPTTAAALGLDPAVSCSTATTTPGGTATNPGTTTPTAYRVNVPEGLNVRSGPGSGFAVIDGLANGATVQVIGTTSGFSQIGAGRWVASQFLVPATTGGANTAAAGGTATPVSGATAASFTTASTSAVGAGTYTVGATNGINIRANPDVNAPIIGSLGFGQTVQVTGTQVASDGFTWAALASGGYVATDFLQ